MDNLPVESVVDGFDNNAAAQVVTSRHLDEFLATGERLATQALAQNKGRLVTCPGAPGCDRTFITSFGRRAFRRPLTADEVQRYSPLFAPSITGNSSTRAWSWSSGPCWPRPTSSTAPRWANAPPTAPSS